MNSWGNDYGMQNQFIPMNNMGPPNMMPPPMQPLMPPMCMMSDLGNLGINTQINPAPPVVPPLIGPVMPEEPKNDEAQIMHDGSDHQKHDQSDMQGPPRPNMQDGNKDRMDRRGDRNRDRDRSNRRRSRSHDRFDRGGNRNDRNRNDRGDRSDRPARRDRPSKWGKPEHDVARPGHPPGMGMGNNGHQGMMPGVVPYNMMNNNMMGQQPMEMGNMGNMGMGNNMQNMPNMMPGMNMMSNMMPNMMDPMMMSNMMNPQMSGQAQTLFLPNCVLLPPIPGSSVPNRREKPLGCRTIFVGGLPHGISEEVVHEMFQRFGGIDDIKLHRQGVCHVRFENHPSVEASFFLTGYRFKLHDQADNEATTLFIDYALNRDDQNEYERNKRQREPTPPRIEPFTPANLSTITEKIKTDEAFAEVAPTLLGWLERGECNKRNANTFYSLIQAANNQVRRLFNDKMQLDDELQTMRNTMREKFERIIMQFEQVAKILTVAKHQRVSDHFTKQQRRNIEMWLKMTEELENIKEEFASFFDDEENEKVGKSTVLQEKFEELKKENENLMFELEGYRNEAHLAKDEAERKFEKFKAQFIAQQALQNPGKPMIYPPLPPSTPSHQDHVSTGKPEPPPPTPDDMAMMRGGDHVSHLHAKLVSMLTAFLLVHPLGATQDYLVSYVRSMIPSVTHASVQQVLQKYNDIFRRKTKSYGSTNENRWEYVMFNQIKHEY
ncbi:ecto-NOX disulfide-thiol exchanger 2-like isoform X1 [Ostrinia furnacalis]|uniref:ecto-NOX disulfide-thiol exchanger 2-like isoform X1 n=1 Tax=Ostrinia furnacalis TaxID=93504 RepID=UPI00103DC59E|nr:ecto-NOX disulfide-thiol exchanger 2-like isoform X1 [Ostrinia furnacalis]